MERNIIFAHELIKLDVVVFIDPPPLVILLKQISRDRNVSYWRVEPYIENLLFELLQRNTHTPFQISSNAFGLEPFLQPTLSYRN